MSSPDLRPDAGRFLESEEARFVASAATIGLPLNHLIDPRPMKCGALEESRSVFIVVPAEGGAILI